MKELTPDLNDSIAIEMEPREVKRIELQLRCGDLSRRCSELEAQLGQKQREVDDFITTLESLKAEVKGLHIELAAQKIERDELRARVSHLEQERGVIDISDGEDDDNMNSGVDDSKKYEILVENLVKDEDFVIAPAPESHRSDEKGDVPIAQVVSDREEEGVGLKKGEVLEKDEDFVVTPASNRKRALRLVDSDSEKEDGEEKGDVHIDQEICDAEKDGIDWKKGQVLEKSVDFMVTPPPKRKLALRLVDSDSEKDGERGDDHTDKENSDAEEEGVDSKNGEVLEKDEDFVFTPAPNRKRAKRIVNSDSEQDEDDVPDAKLKKENQELDCFSDSNDRKNQDVVVPDDDVDDEDEDDVPIGKLIERRVGNRKAYRKAITPSRKRLVKIGEGRTTRDGERRTSPRDSVSQNPSHSKTNSIGRMSKRSVIQKLVFSDNGDADEKEVVVVDSESEGDSLAGFIVDESESSSNGSSEDETGEGGLSDTSGEDSGSEVDLGKVLSTFRRKKDTKKWQYEGDMLASFADDPKICMKAVLALYRRQTSEEQSAKETIVVNNRGFNQPDALRASMIVEFLLDGNTSGPLNKSVKELEERYPNAVEYCCRIAYRYSKQLFSIYQHGEDPFFRP